MLSTDDGPLSFEAERGGPLVYQFSSDTDEEIVVLKPGTGDRFTLTAGGSFKDSTTTGDQFWAASIEDFKRPFVARDSPSDLANSDAAYDYVIVSAPGLMASAAALRAYRESAEGGGFKVLVADIQDVFDQFDYGRRTPIAIQRLIEHSRSWQVVPEFVTFWGDALYPDPRRERFSWEVPSFGHASGDGWFAMFANGNLRDFTESTALGRVPIRTNEQGNQFVEKLRVYENTPLGTWQKQVTLMAGGTTQLEQSLLHGATRNWGNQIRNGEFGADVTFFMKSESTALDPTFLDSVDAAIARGTSWLAFFGHSAADSWEIVTTPPTRFNNAGFLPMAVSLGCFTGAFARGSGDPADNPVYAELLVTESSNGAIAHFGGSTSSFISSARGIGQALYDEVFDRDKRIIGHAVRAAKRAYLEKAGLSRTTIETAMQYNLIGDPATRLNLPTKPDFEVEARSISIDPTTPVAGLDSVLTVEVEVRNRGKVPADSITISLSHVSPANARTNYSARLAAFPLLTTTEFLAPFGSSDVGDHRFEVVVDSDFEFEEELETNNRAEKTRTVFASGVIQLFPLKFGLVTSRQPTLQIGAASSSGEELAVFVELDSVATFDSPGVVRDQVRVSSITDWKPQAPLVSSRSYFWRVRVDDPVIETSWSVSSFTVREDLPASGWLQQGSQFAGNTHGRFLEYTNNRWRFKQFNVDIILQSRVAGQGALANFIAVSGTQYNRIQDGIGVVILDGRGTVKDGAYDSFFLYPDRFDRFDPAVELARLDSLLSTAQEGEYVLVNTYLVREAVDAEGILEGAKQFFRDLGST
ncbi:MAG: C25 family cysteine peptidase, partial [Rhodothermia bacterium]